MSIFDPMMGRYNALFLECNRVQTLLGHYKILIYKNLIVEYFLNTTLEKNAGFVFNPLFGKKWTKPTVGL